jgi:hypothetical protein
MSTARVVVRVVQTTESVAGKPIPGALPGVVIASFVLLGVSPPRVALAGLSETRGRCIGELAASISGSLWGGGPSVEHSAGSPSAASGGVSVGLRDLDAKSLRGVPEASVVAVETLEVLTQAYDGCIRCRACSERSSAGSDSAAAWRIGSSNGISVMAVRAAWARLAARSP